jgi:hypothetical protein
VVYILFLVCYLGFRIDTACPYDMHMCKLKPKKKAPIEPHTQKLAWFLVGTFLPPLTWWTPVGCAPMWE